MTGTRRSTADANERTDVDPNDEGDAGSLVVVCGLPGVGKTTVAKRIADHVDAAVLRTDAVRKELFPEPTYSEEETARVYAELLDRARDRLVDERSVVLDATFAKRRFRDHARELGSQTAAAFRLVKVECTEREVKRRIERRDGLSDADFEIHLQFRSEFDEIESDHLTVDNSGSQDLTFSRIDTEFS